MELLKKSENEQYKYTLAFVGYGPEQDNLVIELTYNWGDNSYTKGDAYAQVAIQTTDGARASFMSMNFCAYDENEQCKYTLAVVGYGPE